MSLTSEGYVDPRLQRVLTQFRESARLNGLIRTDLEAFREAGNALLSIPTFFDIADAVGEQLTIIGKWLGFPRCHCVCTRQPVFGFDCEGAIDGLQEIAGFCHPTAVWADCQTPGVGDICIGDDEAYRGMLYSRIFQNLSLYDHASLEAAARAIWGETAFAENLSDGAACVAPGRDLSEQEVLEVPVAFRALPFAPGITTYVHFGAGPLFGFGAGWGDLCSDAVWFCPERIDAYACN